MNAIYTAATTYTSQNAFNMQPQNNNRAVLSILMNGEDTFVAHRIWHKSIIWILPLLHERYIVYMLFV